ncbi:hypothetical protein GKJPGBOP_00491 [Streptomyces paromomycinus]|uniref:Uncharacterized protein n=1 Tax=Streptomyces paromomycinus TaxID=92743 RepID=A0A401VUX6_STREY|nr:hypothetical protein GKJPGBOP_00491 [Streptomyces paromomycinus]
MTRRNPRKVLFVEVGLLAVSGALAAALAARLLERGVGTAVVAAVVCCTLTVGLSLAAQFDQGMRTTLYTCPVSGCAVSVRVRGASPEALCRLRALATDHSRHGAT